MGAGTVGRSPGAEPISSLQALGGSSLGSGRVNTHFPRRRSPAEARPRTPCWTREGRATRGQQNDISEEAGKLKGRGSRRIPGGLGDSPQSQLPRGSKEKKLGAGTEAPTHVGLTPGSASHGFVTLSRLPEFPHLEMGGNNGTHPQGGGEDSV